MSPLSKKSQIIARRKTNNLNKLFNALNEDEDLIRQLADNPEPILRQFNLDPAEVIIETGKTGDRITAKRFNGLGITICASIGSPGIPICISVGGEVNLPRLPRLPTL